MKTPDQLMAGVAMGLYEKLTEEYPAPWCIEYHQREPHHSREHVSKITTRDCKKVVLSMETFTGDGDTFSLGDEGAIALAWFVNSMRGMVDQMAETRDQQ